jgi:hypothetical protein
MLFCHPTTQQKNILIPLYVERDPSQRGRTGKNRKEGRRRGGYIGLGRIMI